MNNPFEERARIEGFQDPIDSKNHTAHRYLSEEMNIWAQLSKEAHRDVLKEAQTNLENQVRQQLKYPI